MRLTRVDRASHTDEAQRIDASCIPTHNVHNVLPVFRIVLSGALRIELLSCLMTTSALTRLLTQPHWPCECASPLSAPKTHAPAVPQLQEGFSVELSHQVVARVMCSRDLNTAALLESRSVSRTFLFLVDQTSRHARIDRIKQRNAKNTLLIRPRLPGALTNKETHP
jgi:hypothetical protein